MMITTSMMVTMSLRIAAAAKTMMITMIRMRIITRMIMMKMENTKKL